MGDSLMLPLFILAALAYGAASFAYGATSDRDLARDSDSPSPSPFPRLILAGAVALHFFTIGAQCVEGLHPFRSVFLAASFGVWLAIIGYLLLSLRGGMRQLGAALSPVGLIGLTFGVVMGPGNVEPGPASTLIHTHIALAIVGVAGFALATGVAGLYLAMDRRLREKKFRPGAGGLSLTGLDKLHYTLVLFVTPVFTVAIITGSVWLLRQPEHALAERGLELAAGGVAFVASMVSLVGRAAWGLRGRKAALLTMVAFAAMIAILISYGLRA